MNQKSSVIQILKSVPWVLTSDISYPLADKHIQPIWIEIDNREENELYLMLLSIDPEYFSPSEVAWDFRRFKEGDETRSQTYEQIADYFLDRQIPLRIPPESTVSGFVYTNLDPGRKAFTVELLGKNISHSFDYFQGVPEFRPDFAGVDLQAINTLAERRDLSLGQLRSYLEALPCCASGGDRKTPGDPLNLVFVGSGKTVLAAMARQGWDLTETTRASTVGRMVTSSLFKS
ncbi:MAG: LssY C-terminal domain-containing protein, partial [Roseobacter sp.]